MSLRLLTKTLHPRQKPILPKMNLHTKLTSKPKKEAQEYYEFQYTEEDSSINPMLYWLESSNPTLGAQDLVLLNLLTEFNKVNKSKDLNLISQFILDVLKRGTKIKKEEGQFNLVDRNEDSIDRDIINLFFLDYRISNACLKLIKFKKWDEIQFIAQCLIQLNLLPTKNMRLIWLMIRTLAFNKNKDNYLLVKQSYNILKQNNIQIHMSLMDMLIYSNCHFNKDITIQKDKLEFLRQLIKQIEQDKLIPTTFTFKAILKAYSNLVNTTELVPLIGSQEIQSIIQCNEKLNLKLDNSSQLYLMNIYNKLNMRQNMITLYDKKKDNKVANNIVLEYIINKHPDSNQFDIIYNKVIKDPKNNADVRTLTMLIKYMTKMDYNQQQLEAILKLNIEYDLVFYKTLLNYYFKKQLYIEFYQLYNQLQNDYKLDPQILGLFILVGCKANMDSNQLTALFFQHMQQSDNITYLANVILDYNLKIENINNFNKVYHHLITAKKANDQSIILAIKMFTKLLQLHNLENVLTYLIQSNININNFILYQHMQSTLKLLYNQYNVKQEFNLWKVDYVDKLFINSNIDSIAFRRLKRQILKF